MEKEQGRILSAVVHSRSLGRNIRLCIWKSDDKKVRKLYFSTDTQMKAMEKGTVLSMASVKVLCHNLFLMKRFISVLGIKPNEKINRRLWEDGVKFAAIAA